MCQAFPLILRKAVINGLKFVRFAYVYPCGSGSGFQWISNRPITDQFVFELVTRAEPFYEQCFCDQVDRQDSHQNVDFNVIEQYSWIQNYISTINVPIAEELLTRSELSSRTSKALMLEVQNFLNHWNNYASLSTRSAHEELTLDVLTKKELGSFNAFAIWILYNARLMEITEPRTRWKVTITLLLFPIYHVLMQQQATTASTEEKDWTSRVNEACWDTVYLVINTLPTLAREDRLSSWKHLERVFRLLKP